MTINKREQGIEQILDLRRIEQELGTRRFRNFVALGWKVAEPARPFIRSWHTDAIADHLQAVTEGQIKRLLINVPPGHGKSLLVSVLWPAWQWIAHPQLRGICTSYDHDLSVRDSVRCRGVLTSRWYQETFRPGWRFTDDQNAKDWFVNDHQGFRMALAVGGKGTGFRGDYIIVDDPLNARKQHSDAALNDVTFWFDQAMSSRLNDPSTGSIVIIMQRLSERDLAGHVLARDTYEHLNLSTEYEPERRCVTCLGHPDPRTHEGELLFPHLFPASAIAEAKQVLGSQGFSAQHQQRPAPAEGGIFKRQWWRFWKPRDVNLPPIRYRDAQGVEHEAVVVVLPEELDEGIQSWDCSFKNQANSDYVAGEVWGRCGANVYLLDQVHRRMDFPETLQAIRDMTRRWPGAGLKLIEDRANGTAVIQSLSRELGGIVAVQPLGGKTARAQAITPRIEAGNVYLPHPAHRGWADDFIEECAQFPFGRHDDWVDAMTQAIARLNVPSQSRAAEPDPEDDDFSYLSNPWLDNLFVQSRMQGW